MAGLIIKCCATGIMGLIAIYFSIKYFKRYKLEKGADDEYWRNVIQWDLLYGKIFVGFAVGIFLLMIPVIFLSEHTLEQGISCVLFVVMAGSLSVIGCCMSLNWKIVVEKDGFMYTNSIGVSKKVGYEGIYSTQMRAVYRYYKTGRKLPLFSISFMQFNCDRLEDALGDFEDIALAQIEHESLVETGIYNDMLANEKELRKKLGKNDLVLIDELIKYANTIDNSITTFTDIALYSKLNQKICDKCADVLLNIENDSLKSEIVFALWHSKNKKHAEVVIAVFETISAEALRENAFYCRAYDNTIAKLAEKKHLEKYLEWANKWYYLGNMPCLMVKLGTWGIGEAKEIFLKQLTSQEDCELYNPNHMGSVRNHAYVNAIVALGKFKDNDPRIKNALIKIKEDCPIYNLRECATLTLKKIEKREKQIK